MDRGGAKRAREAAEAALAELAEANDGLKAVSPAMLARALRAALLGQAAILSLLEERAAPAAEEDESPARVFEIRPIPPDAIVDRDEERVELMELAWKRERVREEPSPEGEALAKRPGRRRRSPVETPGETPGAPTSAPKDAPAPLPEEPPPDFTARFGEADAALAREAIAAFPVEEVKRWLGSGTIFQIRGALAFLNLRSMGGVKVDELRSHIKRMGFADEVGRLVVAGLEGEVLLFRKPEGN